MSLDVSVTIHRGATVLNLKGTADAPSLAARREALVRATGDAAVVVVDLDAATLAGPDALRQLVSLVAGPAGGDRVHLVARRNSVTTALAHWRIHHLVGVHRSVDDAIAAHRALGGRR